MYLLTNYHTHSVFCDGQSTLEEIVAAAKAQKLSVLGFSSHMAWPFCIDCQIAPNDCASYFNAVRELAQKEAPALEILAGTEAEYISGITSPDKALYAQFKPDFIIGSVHYIFSDIRQKHPVPEFFAVDQGAEEVQNGIDRFFNGNAKKAVQTYFALERDMIRNCDFDIIGHADLVRKRNGVLRLFDENESWYRRELKETAKTIAHSGKVTEINTGGMSRAGMTSPYPSADFLSLLKSYDAPIMLNSDSHKSTTLTDHFADGLNAARGAGYKELWYLSGGKWLHREIPATV